MKHYRNSPPPPLNKLAVLLLLGMLAGPAMSQVDWSILGATGAGTCTSLQEARAGRLTVSAGPTEDSIGISWPERSIGALLSGLGFSIGTDFPVFLAVFENQPSPSLANNRSLGTVTSTSPLAAGSRTFTGLKQNTPYVAVLHTTRLFNSWNNNNALVRLCFRTAADLEIPFGSGRAIDGTWSSGCYAFSKDPNQIRACFCGARNSSGSWARTDAEDGYEYMMDTTWRQNVGCTTN